MKTIVCDHDVDATVEEWPVRPYSKSELARAYAPEIGERSALNRLSRWLRGNALLYQALLDTGHRSPQQIFTSKQVGRIVEYIGRPEGSGELRVESGRLRLRRATLVQV